MSFNANLKTPLIQRDFSDLSDFNLISNGLLWHWLQFHCGHRLMFWTLLSRRYRNHYIILHVVLSDSLPFFICDFISVYAFFTFCLGLCVCISTCVTVCASMFLCLCLSCVPLLWWQRWPKSEHVATCSGDMSSHAWRRITILCSL